MLNIPEPDMNPPEFISDWKDEDRGEDEDICFYQLEFWKNYEN